MKTDILIVLFLLLSCTNNKNKRDSVSSELDVVHKEKYMMNNLYDSILNESKGGKMFLKFNKRDVIDLMIRLEEYDELAKLLSEDNNVDYVDFLTANKVKYLLSVRNGETKEEFIHKSLERIRDSISKSPNDYVLFLDYFSFKSFIDQKRELKKELDSIKKLKNLKDEEYGLLDELIDDLQSM